MASIYDWSLTAANNGNADSGINWNEGQPPSTVNNSARVMMTRIKELLNDLGGVAAATGTANAIAVTASSAFSALADGLRLTFRATNTNTGATTLNVNGIGAKTIVKMTVFGETGLSGREIQEDGIYECIYSTLLSGGAGAWLVLNPAVTEIVPAGAGAPFFGTSIPSGWLLCNGAAVSRTTYSRLFSAIGTIWGAGDGSTTFNVPNGQEDYIRGASGALPVGTRQSQSVQSHNHTGTTGGAGEHTHSNLATRGGLPGAGSYLVPSNGSDGNVTVLGTTGSAGTHAHPFTTNSTGGSETRPRSIVANWIIKT